MTQVQLEDQIAGLLKLADPRGEAHERLKKLAGMVERRVMLNLGDRKFLQELVDIRDGAPCTHLITADTPRCAARGHKPCDHIAQPRACHLYEAQRGTAVRTPLGGLR
jgi:hypothetical protein